MSPLALAVDIGGTKIAVGLLDAAGTMHRRHETSTPAQEGAEAIIAAVLATAGIVLGNERVVACGVGTAGVVGTAGEIVSATDLLRDWAGTPLGARLSDALHLPVKVLNDVHAAGLGEARLGAGAGYAAVLTVAVGTGVGGAVVRNGEVVVGAHGIAGSIGHMASTVRDGRACSCGATDHVECHASGPALELDYRRSTGRDLGLREIGRLAAAGDEAARATIMAGARILGTAIGSAINVVDPDVVVVGGGVVGLGRIFFDPMTVAAHTEALGRADSVPILPARFGPDAGLVGAAVAAFASL